MPYVSFPMNYWKIWFTNIYFITDADFTNIRKKSFQIFDIFQPRACCRPEMAVDMIVVKWVRKERNNGDSRWGMEWKI